jgi:cytoskeletal protein CcmA (bactofilin family)
MIETEANLISIGTELHGKIILDHECRIHGRLMGEVIGNPGSRIILGEDGLIEGTLTGEEIWINGTVKGNISAHKRLVITSTGRVLGNVEATVFVVEFGAIFEGQCRMS